MAEELRRRLLADAVYSRNVIDFVTHEGKEIDNLGWHDTEVCLDIGRTEPSVAGKIPPNITILNELR